MILNLKNLFNTLINKDTNIDLDSYRYSLAFFYNIVVIFPFFIYGIYFYSLGYRSFALMKLCFGLYYVVCFFLKDLLKRNSIYQIMVSVPFALYSLISYVNPIESGYGFMWTFFVSFLFVYIIGGKKGALLLMLYLCIILVVGLYDAKYLQCQFSNYLSFSIFYSGFFLFSITCITIDYSFISLHKKISYISSVDPLTKLFNRRKIDEVLQNRVRTNDTLSVAMLDLDDFKNINDINGHHVGDAVLQEFAKILQENIRSTDICGRWGGEEFIILFTNSTSKEVIECVEKIKERIHDFSFSCIKNLTCSFGVSFSSKNTSLDKLIQKADKALYQAKKEGKDKIVIAQ